MSLFFNMLSRFFIAFLLRSKHLLILWLQSPSAMIFGAQENKACHCFHCVPIYLPWSDGTRCHDLRLWMLHFSVQFCHSVMSNSLWPLKNTRPPCPSPTPKACSNSCPLSQWCHPTISSSVVTFSSCLQSSPVSGSFPMSLSFTSCDWNIGFSASASVISMNIQDWFPLGWTSLISL